jgi:hypothetical protein
MDESREQKVHAHVRYLTTHLEQEMKNSGLRQKNLWATSGSGSLPSA